MARNKLTDLNDHLFAQIERLGDEEITEEQLKQEINRSKAINGIAKNIIDNARVTLEGARFANDELPGNKAVPEQFKLNRGE